MTSPLPRTRERRPVPRAERALAWVLRVNGAVTVTALLAVFMPVGWMGAVHARLGLGAAPDGPMFEYLARTVSALYAIHGGLCFVLSTDVRRFGPVITYVACAELAFAAALLLIDVKAGMPAAWVMVEAPAVVFVSGLMLGLRIVARRRERDATSD
ncbi:MAG: hypothetical protein ACAI43_07825 [Phycisphaerae bacterium]